MWKGNKYIWPKNILGIPFQKYFIQKQEKTVYVDFLFGALNLKKIICDTLIKTFFMISYKSYYNTIFMKNTPWILFGVLI